MKFPWMNAYVKICQGCVNRCQPDEDRKNQLYSQSTSAEANWLTAETAHTTTKATQLIAINHVRASPRRSIIFISSKTPATINLYYMNPPILLSNSPFFFQYKIKIKPNNIPPR